MEIVKMLFVTNLLLLLPKVLHCANTYNVGDPVPFFVNKIGPLHNPSETYQYYELPFCPPDHVVKKKESLGEVLSGDRLANALYKLEFAVNKTGAILCHNKLNRDDVAKFRDAIKNDFYYQMYFDDLPLWAFIGKVEDDVKEPKYFLFTHVHFDALYNGDRVIEIHAFSDPSHVADVTEDTDFKVDFTYSVFWNETSTLYKNRMERYSRTSLHPILQKVHWFSLANLIVTVVLLTSLLTVIFTRHLKNDLRKWSIGDEEEEESGWKYNHGHVFICPTNLPLFSAVLGCGTQLLTMVFILFPLAFLGFIYPYSHGSLLTFTFTAYILTSAVASYRSASFCCQYAETGWRRSAVLAGTLFSGPFIIVSFFLNTLATYFGVTVALPLGTIFLVFLIYILVAIPLLVLGGVAGHRHKSDLQPSPVSKKHPKEIRSLAWYCQTPAQMFIAGLLPFSAVIMQLHNLCSTIWGYKIYASPGILVSTFAILIVITALLSIGLTYFQLAGDDHDWWWRSILRGGSTAIFMFIYCIYFYLKSYMRGVVQASFFFGYSACLCYAFFLVLGTVSFQASLLFIRRLYHAGKRDKPSIMEEVLTIHIKPGWKNGTKITFPEKGNQESGAAHGDLIFVVDQKPHPSFKRDGNDLVIHQKISLLDALTGKSLSIKTLDGRDLAIQVSNIVKPGHELVIENEGMPMSKEPGKNGVLRIKFDIKFPSRLTAEQKSDLRRILGRPSG